MSLRNPFRSGPPPPRVALLPDGVFFSRAVPLTPGASPAEVASQVELALEAMSPFPLTQLYYGWFSMPKGERAFVFAAYRRRFTADQLAAWEGAELVLPGFAAVLGAEVEPGTTILIDGNESLTAVHWDEPGMPSQVRVRPLPSDAPAEERERVRAELLAEVGTADAPVINLPGPPEPDERSTDREWVFRNGDFVARIPAPQAANLDVRDKSELASLRSARRRDLVLWRVALGCVAALLLLAVGELALVGGRAWLSVRMALRDGQKPAVDRIMASQQLANHIDDLATNQLTALEMLTALVEPAGRKPPGILFTRSATDKATGLHTIVIEAQTTDAAQMSTYESTIRGLPFVASFESVPLSSRPNLFVFRLTVTFKPGAIKPITQT